MSDDRILAALQESAQRQRGLCEQLKVCGEKIRECGERMALTDSQMDQLAISARSSAESFEAHFKDIVDSTRDTTEADHER